MNKIVNYVERFQAAMVLHTVGDCMGYRNGKWELNFQTNEIHRELNELGGIENLKLNPIEWMASDDTILHLANAEFLVHTLFNAKEKTIHANNYLTLVDYYKKAMENMEKRGPGKNTIEAVSKLCSQKADGFRSPFNERGGGCGSAMRSSCIGLMFSKPEEKNDLIEFALESGRMTHHNPLGYLGGVAAALFTSYAIQGIPVKSWSALSLKDFQIAKNLLVKSQFYVEENLKNWPNFINPWCNYLKIREIESGEKEAKFPTNYGVEERDLFYSSIAGKNWPGSTGLDSVLIAYDALLSSKGDWKELCLRAMLHGGDNDSTGCIAGSWFGAVYGFNAVPKNNYQELEFGEKLLQLGTRFYEMSQC